MLSQRSPPDPLSNLDGPATLALCTTLGDYGEAGGLSHELMQRAGKYATTRFADDLEILLAAARMYHLGGEHERARKTLLRAGKMAPDDARTLRLLGEVLRVLKLSVTPEQAIFEAEIEPASAPLAREQSPIRPKDEDEVPPSDLPERSSLRSSGAPFEPERRQRPSQLLTRQIPAQRSDPEPPEKTEDSSATPSMRRFPIRRISSGKHRAVTAANTPTLPTLRQQRGETHGVELRRTGGPLRVPEPPRQTSEARPSEREREPASSQHEERPRDQGSARAGDSMRGPESTRAPEETTRPLRSSRIRLLDPDDPARHLDRYELIGEIASGGMATVFLARRDGVGGFQRLVAIKRLHPHLAHQDEFVEMFLDEARLAAAIHHPHVVPILESENGHYVVMEFIEGDTLAGLEARALALGMKLPRAVAVRIVLDALAGLHAAHQLKDGEGRLLGLVHRDCTPQNILVGSDGSSRITDFGVARAASRLTITRSQTVKGKVAYLSPEQATAGELDRRSDLFTMGIVLWQVLAGRPLFLADTESMTISRLLTGPIPSVRQYAPDISPELDEVCVRALQRNVSRRYPTAAAMAEALESATRSSIGGAGSPGEVSRCVEMLIGADLNAQREAIRAWAAQNEPSPETRRHASNISELLTARSAQAVDIPRPPPLPQSGMEEALSPADRGAVASLSASAQSTPTTPSSPPPAPEVTSVKAAPVAEVSAAPKAPRAPLSAEEAKKRRTLLKVAAILLVGATSPLWMKPVTHLRDALMAPRKPPGANSTAPQPKVTSTAAAMPELRSDPAEAE